MDQKTMSAVTKRDLLRNDLVFVRDALQRKIKLLRQWSPYHFALSREEYDMLMKRLTGSHAHALVAIDVLDEAMAREAHMHDQRELAKVEKEVYPDPEEVREQ